ncbi:uncharacterized protein [Amphiura filiformis]|uniref:uncharacterized protein n=1 Tax=Amphiura filiformis TaxID=82378 RepID=UPI003B20F4D4
MADPPTQNNAIYHEQSPTLVLAGKIYAGVTGVMVLLAILFCFIQGAKVDGTFNLLGVNLIISTIVIGFLLWWYKTGDLAPDKLWFIVLVASIILFQCITTDIYVFNHETTTAPTIKPPTSPRTITAPTVVVPTNHTNNSNINPPPKQRSNQVKFATLPKRKQMQEKSK